MMTLINTTMLSNESTRSGFEQLLMLSNPPLDNYDDTLDAARSMLRTRQNYVEMDAVKAGSRPTHLSSAACLPSPLLT